MKINTGNLIFSVNKIANLSFLFFFCSEKQAYSFDLNFSLNSYSPGVPDKILLFTFIITGIPFLFFILFLVNDRLRKDNYGPDRLSRQEKLKSKLFRILNDFVCLNLTFAVMLLILRTGQYFFINAVHTLPPDAVYLEGRGFLHDLVLWQFISWILLIPFMLLSLLKRWAGALLFGLVFIICAGFEWALFQYFKVTLAPLDQVIFTYTFKEMTMIAESSVRIDFLTFLPMIVLVLLTLIILFFSLKLKLSKYVLIAFFILSAVFVFFQDSIIPKENESGNPFEYYLVTNKSHYLAEKCTFYLTAEKYAFNLTESDRIASDKIIKEAALRYQSEHPEFEFLGTQYPFLHYENTPDVLSNFFDLKEEKPNLVFIICEALSSCFSGDNKIFGSFTPFLDSLAGQSLYWPNFISTATRTFNVLPAMFGSLPPGDLNYHDAISMLKFPYHLSLIRYLEKSGYYTSFFYGGDPSFNNMASFLKRQSTDYFMKGLGPKYKILELNQGGYSWGYSDSDLFERSFEVMDSVKRSPRLDIYLTLSLHVPFLIPDQEYYLRQFDKIMKKADPGLKREKSDMEKYRNIFATILYTDHSLQEFMKRYSKRPEFSNTIFIITGDHAMSDLNLFRFSSLERYHVPLIIYSPMLKRKSVFHSVSSHLDITPTILAMLHKKYAIEINPVAHWLGSGIDTTREERNIHFVPFIQNNNEILDILDHEYYLDRTALMLLKPGLRLKEIKNNATKTRLNRELEDFRTLNTYVARQNKLIPPEIYFGKFLTGTKLPLPDTLPFRWGVTDWEFKNLCNDLTFNSKFKLIKLEVTVDFKVPKTRGEKLPFEVFDLKNSKGERVLWQPFNFPADSLKAAKPGEWKTISVEDNVDISFLKENEIYTLRMYLWNSKRTKIQVGRPRVRIIGFE